VAIDDVPGNPEPRGLADDVVDPTPAAPAGAVGRRAQAGIVERLLHAGDDGARAVQLVDVGGGLSGNAARLPRPVREDHDVLGQPAPRVNARSRLYKARSGLSNRSGGGGGATWPGLWASSGSLSQTG